jgi:site-specific DNA-methyltransferase (adenine-specific)
VTAVPVNQIICGDNVETLRTLPDACVDSCVTDPPYGLEFMGKAWDRGVPGVELWREVLRVLKPGGHLLAFAGTRTQHRMATAIEDAGFEIRDMIAWCYGSGFPKSLDVSKAIDAQDAAQEQQARRYQFTAWVRSTGVTSKQIDEATETNMGGHYTTAASQPAIMTREHLEACRHLLGEVPEWVERECDIRSIESQTLKNREVVGQPYRVPNAKTVNPHFIRVAEQRAEGPKEIVYSATAPATEAAKQWQGWGTALKPALEPITVARKPLCGTVAANVLQHGTGGINVDGCKVDGERLPANFIHDGSEEAVSLLGEADRFFYCAKAGPEERRQSKHPTIKPVALMRYLVRLVTPPGGLVLDPFGGSGTTAEAARLEHCRFLLMELNPEYCADAAERLRQGVLF